MVESLPAHLRPVYELHGHRIWNEGKRGGTYEQGRRWGHFKVQQELGLPAMQARELARYVAKHGPPGSVPLPSAEPKAQRQNIIDDNDGNVRSVTAKGRRIRTLEDLVDAAQIDLDVWRVCRWRANTWETTIKGADGQPSTIPNFQVRADMERRLDIDIGLPQWSLRLEPPKRAASRNGVRTALVVPDTQHGFRWSLDHTYLHPLHDRRAIDLAVQLAARIRPDVIILLGDHLDLAPWTNKYPRPLDVRDTTTPAVLELHWQLLQLRLAAPTAHIVYIEGNHEHRIYKVLIENMSEATRLRTAAGQAALSIPQLLGLDDLGIEYVGPYGAGYWLFDKVYLHHGDVVRSGGGRTVSAIIEKATTSGKVGHIHRRELAEKTQWGKDGPETITIASPGCLCRVDGIVPANTTRPDWQQGLATVISSEDDIFISTYGIRDGRMAYDGEIFVGEDHSEQIAKTIGYPQIHCSGEILPPYQPQLA